MIASFIHSSQFRRFQELTVYFFAAALVGHYIELAWILLRYHITSLSYIVQSIALVPLPISEPYGLGALAAILIIIPLKKRYKLNSLSVFGASVLMMAVIEYACGLALALVFGQNYFWDYSALPFNLHGYISLETSLGFGALTTLFIYTVYPWAERKLREIRPRQMHAVFVSLILVYALHFVRLAVLSH